MARSTKEEAVETRNRILDAAAEVFHTQGVSRTTLNDVAKAANVTRGAIYWHFKNKADLFDAMCERVCLPMEAMQQAYDEEHHGDPLACLRELCLLVLSETVNNPHSRKVFDIMLHKYELTDETAAIFQRQKEGYMEAMEDIEALLREAVAAGQLPADLDVRLAAVSVHAMLIGLMNNWLFAPESFDLAKASEPVIDACLAAIRLSPSLRSPA